MSRFAVVILYEGLQPSGNTIKALHAALCESGVVEDIEKVEMYKMSEEEIIAAIAIKPLCADGNYVKVTKDETTSPEAKAVIEISKRYGNEIAKGDMYDLFYKMLLDAKPKTDHSLTNAIYVLSREHSEEHIAAPTRKDAALWGKIIDVIRKVYIAVYV
jgi:hypothetical protein